MKLYSFSRSYNKSLSQKLISYLLLLKVLSSLDFYLVNRCFGLIPLHSRSNGYKLHKIRIENGHRNSDSKITIMKFSYIVLFYFVGKLIVISQFKSRKNAIVEYLDYQIPVTQLKGPKRNGDIEAAKRD